MTYDDGTENGTSVIVTETWEGNIIPLAKITELFEQTHNALQSNRLVKTKLVKEFEA